MFAVIDSGTTMTRIYIVDQKKNIVASGRAKVGVRDTSITGSRDKLRRGVEELFFRVLKENDIADNDVEFAIASGMITSEVGLIEIPHLVAPVGLKQLTEGIEKIEDPKVLDIRRPIYFVRGVRNNYPEAKVGALRQVDFMRGEEVQCIGIMKSKRLTYPCNFVALSSHTKVMHINERQEIAASSTTISGQLFEAICNSTNIGKSLVPVEGEEAGGYMDEELIETAIDCVRHAGLARTMLMPRFMQVLMRTDGHEREVFMDAAIAADDINAFREMQAQGYRTEHYVLYGHENRCKMYDYMLKKEFGSQTVVDSIYGKEELDRLTVTGSIAVALKQIEKMQQ